MSINKIKIINDLLKILKIKAIQLNKIKIPNLIFSLNNVGIHYITVRNNTIWYCYNVYSYGMPNNEKDIENYCSSENLYRDLHDNDYNRRIKLVTGTEESINELFEYLRNKCIEYKIKELSKNFDFLEE